MAIMSRIASYDCPLDNKKLDSLDNMNISDSTQITKQINSSAILSSPKSTHRKRKPKARKKKRNKGKCITKVCCIANSLNYNYCKDSNNKIPDAQKNSIRSRTVSESSTDLEDWVVFGDDELHESCNKQRTATSSPTEIRYTPIFNSSMRKNDNFYQQKETVCPRMRYDCLTKMNDERSKNYNRQMQKQHRRLPSDSSECSDDFICFENLDSNSSKHIYTYTSSVATEDIGNETNFHDGDSQLDDSIVFADEDNEKLTTQTKKVSFDPTPVVHVMVTWNYAYRAARRGPWEEIARDNERFKGRIKSIAIVLDPILKSKHRSQVWQERFAFPE
ncbi:PREDICTED: uncharacterized protein LOC108776301 isoform X2 [Cyphomyrmex costatus]|uniref:uncharacterized protein LOC108776301 isoform X2 n=1 Tax=Cyphomyrmex costatus TaxID=456900 RepID=UPI0008524122|nr:PREDICTED: uncharacterized protein LOC108776301 isoform X2 [Cyphomyrmex costatus]